MNIKNNKSNRIPNIQHQQTVDCQWVVSSFLSRMLVLVIISVGECQIIMPLTVMGCAWYLVNGM